MYSGFAFDFVFLIALNGASRRRASGSLVANR